MKQTIEDSMSSSHSYRENSTSISHLCMDNVWKNHLRQIRIDTAKQTKFAGVFFHKSRSTSDLDGLLDNPSKKVEDVTSQLKCTAGEKQSAEEIPKPKRPLTAYNLFFRSERLRIIGSDPSEADAAGTGTQVPREKRPHRKTHGKIGFRDLAKQIGKRWKSLDAEKRAKFEAQAAEDMKRYKEEMESYRQKLHLNGGQQEKKVGKGKFLKRKSKNVFADSSSKFVAAKTKGGKVHSASESKVFDEHVVITKKSHIDVLSKAIEICAPDSQKSVASWDASYDPVLFQGQHQPRQQRSYSNPLLSHISVSEVTSSHNFVVDGLRRETPAAPRSHSAFLDDADLLLNDLLLDEPLQLATAKTENNVFRGTESSNHSGNFVNSPPFQATDHAAAFHEGEVAYLAVSHDTRKRRASDSCIMRRRVSLKSCFPDDDDDDESVNSLFLGNSEGCDFDSIFDLSSDLFNDNTSSDLSVNCGTTTGNVGAVQESTKAGQNHIMSPAYKSSDVVLSSLTKSMNQSHMSRQLLHDLSFGVGTQESQHKTVMRRSSETREHLLHALNGLSLVKPGSTSA